MEDPAVDALAEEYADSAVWGETHPTSEGFVSWLAEKLAQAAIREERLDATVERLNERLAAARSRIKTLEAAGAAMSEELTVAKRKIHAAAHGWPNPDARPTF